MQLFSLVLTNSLLIGFRAMMGLLECLYFAGYSIKKASALRSRQSLPRKVVSIGNLTLGGTGKTPAVIAVAEKAKSHGYHPCILTRGYRGRIKGPVFVSTGAGPLLSIDEAGDEPVLMATRLRGVPIVKGRDRYQSGLFALSHFPEPSLLFILDDGFQHWHLNRDRDVLLIDSLNPFGNMRLFPSGILREPLSAMERAGFIVITNSLTAGHGKGVNEHALLGHIRTWNRTSPIFSGEHKPSCLRTMQGEELSVNAISGDAVYAFCGIGNPLSFRNTLLALNADVKGFAAFRDHHRYCKGDVDRVNAAAKKCRANWIVTTEKDIIKLKEAGHSEKIIALCIDFHAGDNFYESIFREDG